MAVQLSGPFTFNPATIDHAVKPNRAGVYALGYTINNTFYIERIGRSDTDLAGRLKSDEYKGRFNHFKAAYCDSADAAFHDECELYHLYGGSNNPNHPARPTGKNHKCRHCNLF